MRSTPLRIARPSTAGYTLVELVLAVALAATLVGLSVPATQGAVDEIRAAAAARHTAERMGSARFEAVRRSSAVALKFIPAGSDYAITPHVDGNGNGVRTAEISSGIDATVGYSERLGDKHPGIRLGLLPGVPDLDGGTGNPDGVRIGSSRILTFSPDGSATSGTLYICSTRSQYAVRVLGATGRTRLFRYDTGLQRWVAR
jgi:type II secretory pathway pseudopilin PulG